MESSANVQPTAGSLLTQVEHASRPQFAAADPQPPLRILVLADRDWTHPQGGGTGANVYSNVIRASGNDKLIQNTTSPPDPLSIT